jgi:AraC family transcriptional regulator
MDMITDFNKAVEYMEQHMTDKIDIEATAVITGCSAYHFQRMFSYLANMPLSEYIRRRKMSLAQADIQSGEKILDVALKYGYESPTAFNRAFKAILGITPSALKKKGAVLKAFSPIHFSLSVTGGEELSFRIEKKDAFTIAGISVELVNDLEMNFATIPKMWMKASLLGTVKKVLALQDNPFVPGLLGVSIPDSNDTWRYYIASAIGNRTQAASEKFEIANIPSFTWAIFSDKGTNRDIQVLEQRIVKEWLPSSGYEYDNGPDVEVYLSPDPKKAVFEVWIPVVKK